jgi:hypothetical protein
VHIFIILVEFGSVSLGGESGKTFFVDVDSEWLVAGDDNVDSQIELVPVDQERVCDVPRNN